MMIPERGTGELVKVKSAYNEDEKRDDGFVIDGYLVKLKDVNVRPAKKEEVTFK